MMRESKIKCTVHLKEHIQMLVGMRFYIFLIPSLADSNNVRKYDKMFLIFVSGDQAARVCHIA